MEVGNLIEEFFCVPFEKLQKHNMSEETSKIFITMYLSEIEGFTPKINEEDKPPLYKIIEKRVEHCFQYKLTPQLILFLCQLTQSPGKAIMYLWYFQYYSFKNNIDLISLELISTKIFMIGFPSDKDLSNLWKNCKDYKLTTIVNEKYNLKLDSIINDNLLDNANCGLSIWKK
jgi:hypothetical protein